MAIHAYTMRCTASAERQLFRSVILVRCPVDYYELMSTKHPFNDTYMSRLQKQKKIMNIVFIYS